MRAHNPNGTSIGSAVFAQMTAERVYRLQWFCLFSLKIPPSHIGICDNVICGSLRNYVGYGKSNNFATINLLSRHVYVQNI